MKCLTTGGFATKPKVMGQSCDVFLNQIVNFGLQRENDHLWSFDISQLFGLNRNNV